MNATHYRVSIRIQVTGGNRSYTFTDAADAAEAERRAVAAATVDFGFLNVGITVEGVSVWNFETRSWDAVAEATQDDAKPVADMTDDEVQAEGMKLWVESNGGRLPYFGFFGGGPATVKSKNYLRVLMAKNSDRREAQIIRRLLNGLRAEGETISRADVLPAIRILKAL